MSEPQLHISKEGDRYLRTLLVQGAHYILGPFGQDSDLRRWGLKLGERGGKNAKKRAVVAVARKLAVLLHKLWVGGEVYELLRNNHKVVSAVAWSWIRKAELNLSLAKILSAFDFNRIRRCHPIEPKRSRVSSLKPNKAGTD